VSPCYTPRRASKKRGKKKRSEIQELSEFIRDHMVTKDNLKDALEPIQKTLDEHTRDLDMIKNDVKTNLDKRLTLEVRVANIEKKVFGASQEPAHQ
jgi:chaperonin cofactor prefoldin